MIEGKVIDDDFDDDGVSVYDDDDNFDGGVVDILARN